VSDPQRALEAFDGALDMHLGNLSPEVDIDAFDPINEYLDSIRKILCAQIGHSIQHPDQCLMVRHDLCFYCRSYRESIVERGEKIVFDFREEG